MGFMELAKARFSVRKFADKPVEQEKLDLLLEAGNIAPTRAFTTWYHACPMPSRESVSPFRRRSRTAQSTPSSTADSGASRSTTMRTFGSVAPPFAMNAASAADVTGSYSRLSRNIWRKRLKIIGGDAFRYALFEFWSDLRAGEEVFSRARAFTARLNAEVEKLGALRTKGGV